MIILSKLLQCTHKSWVSTHMIGNIGCQQWMCLRPTNERLHRIQSNLCAELTISMMDAVNDDTLSLNSVIGNIADNEKDVAKKINVWILEAIEGLQVLPWKHFPWRWKKMMLNWIESIFNNDVVITKMSRLKTKFASFMHCCQIKDCHCNENVTVASFV